MPTDKWAHEMLVECAKQVDDVDRRLTDLQGQVGNLRLRLKRYLYVLEKAQDPEVAGAIALHRRRLAGEVPRNDAAAVDEVIERVQHRIAHS